MYFRNVVLFFIFFEKRVSSTGLSGIDLKLTGYDVSVMFLLLDM